MSYRTLKRVFCPKVTNCLAKGFGVLGPLVVPPIHIFAFYYFWSRFTTVVDRDECRCSCWDTVFKGAYESGVGSYHHIYFNATPNTLKIWALVVLGIITAYETLKHLAHLALGGRLRLGMLVLFASVIFSHYYAWWMYFNYWNDEFYSQWNHQLFFAITEVISTTFVVLLADSRQPFNRRKACIISAIAALHILAGGWDQFFSNVIRGKGETYQIIRDVAFMIPDILHVVIPLCSIQWRDHSLPGATKLDPSLKRDLIGLAALVLFGLFINSCL